MQNPFTLTFGKSPLVPVERPAQAQEVVDAFSADPANQQVFILTGVRGSGKTVMLTEISEKLQQSGGWITVDLNPASDLLRGLLAKLSSRKLCAGFIKAANLDLSFFGIGLSVEGGTVISDAETAVMMILDKLKKEGKKLLVTIDEITNNEYMRVFAGSFQIFMRHDLPSARISSGGRPV